MNREKLQGYVFSLPERVVRSVTGLAAGTARELSHVVLPARVRRSRLYDSIVEKTLQFLIEQVGQIEDPSTTAQPLPDDFLIRRASGNVFELAGIVAFHASPVWVLAAIADLDKVAAGTIATRQYTSQRPRFAFFALAAAACWLTAAALKLALPQFQKLP